MWAGLSEEGSSLHHMTSTGRPGKLRSHLQGESHMAGGCRLMAATRAWPGPSTRGLSPSSCGPLPGLAGSKGKHLRNPRQNLQGFLPSSLGNPRTSLPTAFYWSSESPGLAPINGRGIRPHHLSAGRTKNLWPSLLCHTV